MSNILTIAKKELNAYFNSPIAYLLVSAYLALSGGQAATARADLLGPVHRFVRGPHIDAALVGEHDAAVE